MIGIQQVIDQIVTYLQGIWIKKRYVIISTWLICPIGWLYVVSLPDVYESSARVYVDTTSLLRPLLRGIAVYNDPEQQVKIVARTLMSRENLEKIAREADLDISARNDAEFDELIANLRKDIKLNTTREQNIYTISYSANSPALAHKIVQITLNKFIESNLGTARKSNDTASEFLDRRIEEYEQRLEEQEQKRAEFERYKQQILPGAGANYYTQLQNQRSQLEDAKLRLSELESQYDSTVSQLEGEEPVFGLSSPNVAENPSLNTQYDARIRTLESDLDQLSRRYTDQHPDVVQTQRLLEDLRDKRKTQLESISQSAEGSISQFGNVNMNPVYQEMKITAANLESEIASINVRVQKYESNVKSLEEKINLIPEIEAKETGLNRDYEVIKRKHDEFLQRREAANISRQAEASSDDVQFRTIDPPVLPTTPSGPFRILLYSLVLVAGFGIGIGVAFLVSQINPIVINYRQLVDNFDIPVLGNVTHRDALRLAKVNRQRLVIFAMSSSAIICVYAFLVSIEAIYGGFPKHLLGSVL